jgi:hypothetical protein
LPICSRMAMVQMLWISGPVRVSAEGKFLLLFGRSGESAGRRAALARLVIDSALMPLLLKASMMTTL